MAKEPRNRAWAFAFTLSLGLHLLLGGREAAEAAQPNAQTSDTLHMEVLWQELTPTPEPAEPEPEPREPQRLLDEPVDVPPRRPPPRPARFPRPDSPAEPSAALEEPTSDATSSSGESGPGTDAPGTDAPGTDAPGTDAPGTDAPGTDGPGTDAPTIDAARLQPSAVALGTFGPRLPQPTTRRDEEAAMEEALEADLYRIANAAAYDTVRPAPELRETGDGGFTYDGHLFDARISPGGEVTFDDAPGIGFAGLGGPSGTVGVGFSFDISAAAERAAGNDPNSAERRWFMEQTRRIRERLQGEERARIQGRGLVRLRRQLREIWGSAKPAEERREDVFRLWDSCEEDEVGGLARAAIIEFVRDHTGEERSDVFTAEQLQRLNASRMSQERFAPYRAVYEE